MTRFTIFAVGCLALVSLMAQSAYAVPVTSSFTARIVDAGGPITSNVSLTFKIYDNPSSGTLIWEETHPIVTPDTGLVFVELGAIAPETNGLDETVFTGADMFLEVSVNGNIQSPRVPILSVPYAVRAAVADEVVNENDPVFEAAPAAGITAGDIAAWNSDNNTQLTEAQVDAFANNNGYSTGAHAVNTNTQLSQAQVGTFVNNLGYRTGAHTTNTNTQLSEAQVDNFVGNNGYSLTSHNHTGVYATAGHTHAGGGDHTHDTIAQVRVSFMVMSGPNNTIVAHGMIDANGTVISGSGNWSAVWNTAGSLDVTIEGVNFVLWNFTTLVTPATLASCRYGSSNGRLQIHCRQ